MRGDDGRGWGERGRGGGGGGRGETASGFSTCQRGMTDTATLDVPTLELQITLSLTPNCCSFLLLLLLFLGGGGGGLSFCLTLFL